MTYKLNVPENPKKNVVRKETGTIFEWDEGVEKYYAQNVQKKFYNGYTWASLLEKLGEFEDEPPKVGEVRYYKHYLNARVIFVVYDGNRWIEYWVNDENEVRLNGPTYESARPEWLTITNLNLGNY